MKPAHYEMLQQVPAPTASGAAGGEQGCIARKAEPGDKKNRSFGGKLSPQLKMGLTGVIRKV